MVPSLLSLFSLSLSFVRRVCLCLFVCLFVAVVMRVVSNSSVGPRKMILKSPQRNDIKGRKVFQFLCFYLLPTHLNARAYLVPGT